MRRVLTALSLVTATLGLAVTPPAEAHGNVNIGLDVGAPPPPPPDFVLPAPPHLVVVPDSPVFYAPRLSINLFAYGGRYYTYDHGAWFTAPYYSGPWSFIPFARVPERVRAVPVAYYRVPP